MGQTERRHCARIVAGGRGPAARGSDCVRGLHRGRGGGDRDRRRKIERGGGSNGRIKGGRERKGVERESEERR